MSTHTLRFRSLSLLIVLFATISVGQMRSGKFGVGINGAMYYLGSDRPETVLKPGGGISLSYSAMEHLGIRSMVGLGQLGWTDAGTSGTTTMFSANVYVSFDLLPQSAFNPFVFGGVGYIYFDPRDDKGTSLVGAGPERSDINYLVGGGIDFFPSEFLSITLSGELAITNTDYLDGLKGGSSNDGYNRFNLEVRYYFFDQNFITKMLEAMRARQKGK